MTGPRVPYMELTADEKAVLHAWFDAHGVDHRNVPLDPNLRLDEDGFHVLAYKRNAEGRLYLEDGEIAREWVTFQPTSPMPWRAEVADD